MSGKSRLVKYYNLARWLAGNSTMNESMYFLVKMEIFQPVMLVFRGVNIRKSMKSLVSEEDMFHLSKIDTNPHTLWKTNILNPKVMEMDGSFDDFPFQLRGDFQVQKLFSFEGCSSTVKTKCKFQKKKVGQRQGSSNYLFWGNQTMHMYIHVW